MADALISAAKAGRAVALRTRLRWIKAREAQSALKVLARNGRTVSSALRRRAREDAVERLGAARHAGWLMLYAAVQGRYRDGWVPESHYLETVMPRVNGITHHIARTSASTPILFESPAICDLLYIVNGRLLSTGAAPLTPTDALARLRAAGAEVIFKLDGSAFGRGVRTLDVAALDEAGLLRLGNGVFQPKIAGHPVFDRFGSPALATLRIISVLPSTGAPEIRSCYLKLGRPHQTHVIARDQLRVAVDWKTGALAETGYLSDWQPCNGPPGSIAQFGGVVVPAISEATRLAVSLHSQMPLPRFVAWDFAIDKDEKVRLLEWEGGVVSFAEATQGPCFIGLSFK